MTLFGLSDDEPEIFVNRDVLKDRYLPDEIVGRDEEKRELNSALRPVLRGTGSPDNVFISGPTGVGKTALARNAMDQMEMERSVDVRVIWLNCQSIAGETTLMLEIANQFRETGNKLATRGYNYNQARDHLFRELGDADADTVLIVLDELDTVDIQDQLLYHLPRAHEHGIQTEVGLISISNQPDFINDIPADVRSTLTDVHIQFSEYDATQIRNVLKQRTVLAFRDTTLTEDGEIKSPVLKHESVAFAAAKGTKHTGDARMARDVLRTAGDIAVDRGDTTVTEVHVREAVEQYHRSRMVDTVSGFGDTAKTVLYALISLYADGRECPRTSEVNTRYQELVESSGMNAVSKRQVEKYMKKYERVGLTETTIHGGEGGRYTTHSLQYEPEVLVEAITDVMDVYGVHRSVQPMVQTAGAD
jgi:cell division control protein 6